MGKDLKWLILSDIHIPRQHTRRLNITMDIAREWGPDVITLNGDIDDMSAPSRWARGSPDEWKDRVEITTDTETKGFLEKLREDHPDSKIDYFGGNHECLSYDMRVLTFEGLKYVDELEDDDSILSVSRFGDIRWHRVMQIHQYDEPCEMMRIKGSRYSLEVTPNHTLVAAGPNGPTEEWEAQDAPDRYKTYTVPLQPNNRLDNTNLTNSSPERITIDMSTAERYTDERGCWCVTVPNGKIFVEKDGHVVLTGNSRLREYVANNAPALDGLVTIPKILGLENLGIEWRRYEEPPKKMHGGFYVHHGTRTSKHVGTAVRKEIEKYGVSMIMGHVHSMGTTSKNTLEGVLRGYEGGHLMDEKKADYETIHNWQPGFLYAYVHGGEAHIKRGQFIGNTIYFEGNKYT